jgi:hypothetical protein
LRRYIYTVPEICYSNILACRNVKVTVEGNNIVVDPATVTVTGRDAPVVIVWYLATPGYKFASPSPVAIPADPAINRYQFMPSDDRFCYWWRTPTVYVCHDYNYATLNMGYTIKVDGMSGSSPSPGSGRIVNN